MRPFSFQHRISLLLAKTEYEKGLFITLSGILKGGGEGYDNLLFISVSQIAFVLKDAVFGSIGGPFQRPFYAAD